jgi:hypothetical protein
MKTINAKLFALKYKLIKRLNASLEKDKNAIKEGAKITFKNYCKIQIVECSKKSYSKEVQQELEEYAKSKGYEKQETKYLRIDVDNIPTEVDNKVTEIFNTLEHDNDQDIKRVASKVATAK